MQVKKQQLEPDMEQQTGSKLGKESNPLYFTKPEFQTGSKQEKEYFKAVYCHLAYLTYIQNISC